MSNDPRQAELAVRNAQARSRWFFKKCLLEAANMAPGPGDIRDVATQTQYEAMMNRRRRPQHV